MIIKIYLTFITIGTMVTCFLCKKSVVAFLGML